MRAIFQKHIASVESAIRAHPTNSSIWDIWAWMARGLPEYKWASFVNSLETFDFPNLYITSPPGDICVWMLSDAKAKKDWETVIKYAKRAARVTSRIVGGIASEWGGPGGGSSAFASIDAIEDYPGKSAYGPDLEALLRLGRVDEANAAYDAMIRVNGRNNLKSSAVKWAAMAAREVGMEDLAKIWELGEQVNKEPYWVATWGHQTPWFFVLSDGYDSDYFEKFAQVRLQLRPILQIQTTPSMVDVDTLGWEKGDGNKWALVDDTGRVLAQGSSIPAVESLQEVFLQSGMHEGEDVLRMYIASHSDMFGLEFRLAMEIMANTSYDDSAGERVEEAARYLRRMINESPETMYDTQRSLDNRNHAQHPSLKALAPAFLSKLEDMIKNKPSQQMMWNHWLFWREAEGAQRPIEPLFEGVQASPMSQPGTVPPINVMNAYYDECKKNEEWPKVIKLLQNVWDREIDKINGAEASESGKLPLPALGDRVGVPLIEALLKDHKPLEAGELFDEWLGYGGKFTNISSLAEIARATGQERLAREWEEKAKK
jgi:tetratricopeptide (TPR) repeat protein